jgi:hypothetical protein
MRPFSLKPIDLSQIFLSIGAVIPDRGVDAIVAHGCHEDHQRAEAIAEQGNFTIAFRETACRVDGVLDVPHSGISVISRIEAKAVLPVGFGSDVQVDTRLLPPEQVWSEREITLLRQFIAVLAKCRRSPQTVPAERQRPERVLSSAAPYRRRTRRRVFDGDVIFHCVLLGRPHSFSIRASADVMRIGGGVLFG